MLRFLLIFQLSPEYLEIELCKIFKNCKKRVYRCLEKFLHKKLYKWLRIQQAIGARLEELLAEDKQNVNQVIAMVSDESKQRDLIIEDEEEDFLDEGKLQCNKRNKILYNPVICGNTFKFHNNGTF